MSVVLKVELVASHMLGKLPTTELHPQPCTLILLWKIHKRHLRQIGMSWLGTTLGVRDPTAIPSLSQGELLSTKTTSWVDTLQLTRTVSQKWNYISRKSRSLFRNYGLWWIRSLYSFWQVVLPTCCAGFHGISCAKSWVPTKAWGPATLSCNRQHRAYFYQHHQIDMTCMLCYDIND